MIRRLLFLGLIFLIAVVRVHAQYTIQGTVVDAESGEAVEAATVQLMFGNQFVAYGISNDKGVFNLKSNRMDSLRIVISSIGYKTFEQAVRVGESLNIRLEQAVFALQEVVVRPGRVWNRRDTINYDVNRFLTSKDNTIQDVLKKLPGINVDDKGKISYQGKDISNFYVEGMDAVGGRYNQITNNLRAESVETVQVMENHQSVKMLEDLVASEDVALNLKLKAEFQAVWMFSLEGGIGLSPLLWRTSDNAIRLSKTNQSVFSYKGNNTGNDITIEQDMLVFRRNSFMETPSNLSFLSTPSIMAPLKKERLLFNNVHALTANRMYKLNETTRMRINANYTRDERKQERGSETIYYFADDSTRITETSNTKLSSDEAALSIHIENNAADKYLTNSFNVTGNRNRGVSNFTGVDILTAAQRLHASNTGASNDFRTLWGKQDYRYEIRSLLRYDRQPEELRADNIEQKTLLSRFYTDNSFSITGKKKYFVPQYAIGFTSDVNNLQTGITPYVAPNFQWNKNKWQTRFSLPVVWTNYPEAGFSRLSVRPSAGISYKLNYAWRLSLSAGYREQYGDILNFHREPYYADYRHIVRSAGQLPILRVRNYTLYGEYKKTATEFFASLLLSYVHSRNSHIYEQTAEGGYISMISREIANGMTSRRIAGTLSKGFYDIKLTTSLSAQYSQHEGAQYSRGATLPYLSNHLSLDPKINWNYLKNFELSYLANIALTGSKIGERELEPIWAILQKLQLACFLPSVEVVMSADHYYNEVNDAAPVRNYFVDFAFRYKHKKWRFSAELNNLLNKQQYGYMEYSGIRSYGSWINIRGREFITSVQYKF